MQAALQQAFEQVPVRLLALTSGGLDGKNLAEALPVDANGDQERQVPDVAAPVDLLTFRYVASRNRYG